MPKRTTRNSNTADGSDLPAETPKFKRQKMSVEEIAKIQPVPEVLRPNLDILFVGINPGVISGQKQLHFGNPQNYFWRGMYQSGLIPDEIQPEDGHMIHERWNMSIVNLVQRTTPSTSDLSRREMRNAVPDLCRKITTCRPKVVCFVGKGIYEAFIGSSSGFDLGLQLEVYDLESSETMQHPPLRQQLDGSGEIQCAGQSLPPAFAYLFVMPSTSGRAATYRNADKLQYFRQLKYVRDCVQSAAAAAERGTAPPQIDHGHLDSLMPRQVKSKYFTQ
ncbi:uracil DNA N-glycosylase Thp1 [Coemansia erecta]|nr:uracil DNA N-glycosylase Thp1 [Coemansia erecta]